MLPDVICERLDFLVFLKFKKTCRPRLTVLVHIKCCGKIKNLNTVCRLSRLRRGPIYLPHGFLGSFLKMVNFEMSRRYCESNFNPICTCRECYLYSSITQNGGAIILQITLKAAKHSAFSSNSGSTLLTLTNSSNWSLYISLKG